MRRLQTSAICGGVFGAGLLMFGKTNTVKVQGLSGCVRPVELEVAFIMADARLPMAIAWWIAARRKTALLSDALPAAPSQKIDADLAAGPILFGMGGRWWAYALPLPCLAFAAEEVWSFFWPKWRVCLLSSQSAPAQQA